MKVQRHLLPSSINFQSTYKVLYFCNFFNSTYLILAASLTYSPHPNNGKAVINNE